MLVFYHKDNDGYCSAAVCNCYLVNGYDMPSNEDFISYTHGETLDISSLREIREGERVYILDLAMDDTILELTMHCLSAGAVVVHIDHHKSGKDYIDALPDVTKAVLDRYAKSTKFIQLFETALSACMLTYIYSSMNMDVEDPDSEQLHPMDVSFATTPDWTTLVINPGIKERKIVIPLAVRYCDDYDVWRWFHKDTEAFNLGFEAVPYRNNPCSKEWAALLNKERITIPPIVNAGYNIIGYRDAQYKRICEHGFEATICGVDCYVVNTPYGDSKLFGDKIDEYPMCVMYRYSGKYKKYKLEFRSGDNGIDVSEVAKALGGGGHFHAAGCEIDNIDHVILHKESVTFME